MPPPAWNKLYQSPRGIGLRTRGIMNPIHQMTGIQILTMYPEIVVKIWKIMNKKIRIPKPPKGTEPRTIRTWKTCRMYLSIGPKEEVKSILRMILKKEIMKNLTHQTSPHPLPKP